MELSQVENKIIEVLTKFHNTRIAEGDYPTTDLFEELDSLLPIGAISGYSPHKKNETEGEWLFDYFWYQPADSDDVPKEKKWQYFKGLDLVCEVEWSYPTSENFENILSDLQKLMVAKANTYLFITQLRKETDESFMIKWLESRMCIDNFSCLFILMPVKQRQDNSLRNYLIHNNQFHKV